MAQAGAGKASLSTCYANQEERFAAVVRRMMDRTLVPSADVPWHLSVHDRLRAVGHSLLDHALAPQAIAPMRVAVTTAHWMPDLARLVDGIGRDGGVACVARAIAGIDAATDAIKQAASVVSRFIDMVFVPRQMHALIGDDREQLEAGAARRIDDVMELLARVGCLPASD